MIFLQEFRTMRRMKIRMGSPIILKWETPTAMVRSKFSPSFMQLFGTLEFKMHSVFDVKSNTNILGTLDNYIYTEKEITGWCGILG